MRDGCIAFNYICRKSTIFVESSAATDRIGNLMKKHTITILIIELLSVCLFVFYPSPIESVAWKPSRIPALQGVLERNSTLRETEVFAVGALDAPEDVAIAQNGMIYTGLENGDIVTVALDGTVTPWVNTGGRPLGMKFNNDNDLIVCDGYRGLLSISKTGEISVLTDHVEGNPINFANGLDIAEDGKIYFTEASSKWDRGDYLHDLLETKPYGRLLMYDPAAGTTSVLMEGLYFANGIALSSDERYLLVTETWRYRVMRYWLKGDKAGSSGQFIGNLPGFPAGISNQNNHFWLSLITLRNPVLDKTHETTWLKDALAKLPEFLTPAPIPYGLVLKVKETGPIESSFHDVGGEVIKGISSAVEKDGYLYFGTFKGDRVGRYKL